MAADLSAHFRLLLDHLDPSDPEDQLAFFQVLDDLKGDFVQELAPRLALVSSTTPLRLLVMEAALYYPGPEWVVPLGRALRREADLEVFATGVRALLRIATPEAELELQRLASLSLDETKQEIMAAALQASDPAMAFEYHLSRLFQGSANPTVANQAATELRRIVGSDHLEDLQVVVYHEDLLISRHALKLITYISDWKAAHFLYAFFLECHQDLSKDRALKATLAEMRNLPLPELRARAMEQVATRFEARAPELVKSLCAEPMGGTGLSGILEDLQAFSGGPAESFLLEVLSLSGPGASGKLAGQFAEVAAQLQARATRLPYFVDTCAIGLETMVARGLVESEHLLDLLFQAFVAQTGREGTARVFGALVSPDFQAHLEAILASPDAALRSVALEAIGARHDGRFLNFLLRACRDPIEDIAGRMVLALGNLEGGSECAIQLLTSRAPEDVRLGLRIIRANRMAGLADMVMAFLDACTREELALEAVATLGDLWTVDTALLERLHSGQSGRMQVALAQALAGRDPEGTAMALGRAALELRNAEVWQIAAGGLVAAWAPRGAMPDPASRLLVELARNCWDDASPSQKTRLLQSLRQVSGIRSNEAESLLALLEACAEDKRALASWTSDQQNQLAAAIRNLRRQLELVSVAP